MTRRAAKEDEGCESETFSISQPEKVTYVKRMRTYFFEKTTTMIYIIEIKLYMKKCLSSTPLTNRST